LSLVATADPRALDVGLAARSCHKSVIINRLIKKKKTKKKTNMKKKLIKKKKKNLN
jgi:hypothetical protein